MYRSIAANKIYDGSKKAPVFKRIANWYKAHKNGRVRSIRRIQRINPDYHIYHEWNIRIDIERAEASARKMFR